MSTNYETSKLYGSLSQVDVIGQLKKINYNRGDDKIRKEWNFMAMTLVSICM